MDVSDRGRVRVFARLRPSLRPGKVSIASDRSKIRVLQADESEVQEKEYTFDGVFPSSSAQAEVFDTVGLPALEESLKGFNSTIFAYGQTGSGKTYSLLDDSGLLPRLVSKLFEEISTREGLYEVEAAAVQIYNEQADDLLHPDHQSGGGQNMTVLSSGNVPGLTWIRCHRPSELRNAFSGARRNLVYAETRMNKTSSRSHAVFQLRISRRSCRLSDNGQNFQSCLNIVDLAGSERTKKSGAEGIRFKEAAAINKSLLALGNVVSSLAAKKPHIPFRDSKLTLLLSDAIGGNCKTVLLACASQEGEHSHETVSTLDFAARAMHIEVRARVNLVGAHLSLEAFHLEEASQQELATDAARAEVALANALEEVQAEGKATALGLEVDRWQKRAAAAEAEVDRLRLEGQEECQQALAERSNLEAERRTLAERSSAAEAREAQERHRAAEVIARQSQEKEKLSKQIVSLEMQLAKQADELKKSKASLQEAEQRIECLEQAAEACVAERDKLFKQMEKAHHAAREAETASTATLRSALDTESRARETLSLAEEREAHVLKQEGALSEERQKIEREFETRSMLRKASVQAKVQAQEDSTRARLSEASRRGEVELERRLLLIKGQEADAEMIAKQKDMLDVQSKTIEHLRRQLRTSSEPTLSARKISRSASVLTLLPLPEKRPPDTQLSSERGLRSKRRLPSLGDLAERTAKPGQSSSRSASAERTMAVGTLLTSGIQATSRGATPSSYRSR